MSLDERQKAAVKAEREESFLLAVPEKRFLRWAAGKLPRWILPDDMTALGVVAALAIAVAYQLSNDGSGWLWAASALLVVQWVGDSLDGTLARVRGIERPDLRLLPRPPRRRDRHRGDRHRARALALTCCSRSGR